MGNHNMEKQEVEAAVKLAAKDGPLTCHDARALAEKLGVEYRVVGQACNDLGVKVRVCELGCFE
jgi:hypothetical protein